MNLQVDMLGVDLAEFPDTTITERFTVWADDFEAELDVHIGDYRELEAAAHENYGVTRTRGWRPRWGGLGRRPK